MKTIRIIIICIFSLIILTPIVTFNFQENAISKNDNRMLAESPFSENVWGKQDFTKSVENYINDRIGLRDQMITAHTLLYDALFNNMIHPLYTNGTEGYIFGAGLTTPSVTYSSYHERFAYMVKAIQDYCIERNTPFLFVFNPAKPAVYSEFTPKGLNYSRKWVDQFLTKLDELGVRYIDNTKTLLSEKQAGKQVFNIKYDPNHWNYLGALIGTNAILAEMQKDFPHIHINTADDIEVSSEFQKTQSSSTIIVNETVPKISVKGNYLNISGEYKPELIFDPSYTTFGYYINNDRADAPKALVFQGSYMNVYGKEFMANSFSEYIHVHDYQNVINFPYYFNAFKPDCVIFEVAEYTFKSTYFNYDKMGEINFNPSLYTLLENTNVTEKAIANLNISVTSGDKFAVIQWITQETFDNCWLTLDCEYDMIKQQNGYTATVPLSAYNQNPIQIYAKGDKFIAYK